MHPGVPALCLDWILVLLLLSLDVTLLCLDWTLLEQDFVWIGPCFYSAMLGFNTTSNNSMFWTGLCFYSSYLWIGPYLNNLYVWIGP